MASKPTTANLYEILNVSPNAPLKDIDLAYKKLALKYHPDKTGGGKDEIFHKIQEAGEILRDPKRRGYYDFELYGEHTTSYDRQQPHPYAGNSGHHPVYDAYAYSYGHSVHMNPDSFESLEEKARHATDLEEWGNRWAGIDPEVERAKAEVEAENLQIWPETSNVPCSETASADSQITHLGRAVQERLGESFQGSPEDLLRILQPFVNAKLENGQGRYSDDDLLGEVQGAVSDITSKCPGSISGLSSAEELCLHPGPWERRFGAPNCENCQLWRPAYNVVCEYCGQEACVRCRSSL